MIWNIAIGIAVVVAIAHFFIYCLFQCTGSRQEERMQAAGKMPGGTKKE